jgi:hypothetical protein
LNRKSALSRDLSAAIFCLRHYGSTVAAPTLAPLQFNSTLFMSGACFRSSHHHIHLLIGFPVNLQSAVIKCIFRSVSGTGTDLVSGMTTTKIYSSNQPETFWTFTTVQSWNFSELKLPSWYRRTGQETRWVCDYSIQFLALTYRLADFNYSLTRESNYGLWLMFQTLSLQSGFTSCRTTLLCMVISLCFMEYPVFGSWFNYTSGSIRWNSCRLP